LSLYGTDPFDNTIPPVSPVSPNSAALFKATERPAGSFTGTTPISIPLFNISAGTFNIPASLNYSNGGIRWKKLPALLALVGTSLPAEGYPAWSMACLMMYLWLFKYYYQTVGWPGAHWLDNTNELLRGRLDVEPIFFILILTAIRENSILMNRAMLNLSTSCPLHLADDLRFIGYYRLDHYG